MQSPWRRECAASAAEMQQRGSWEAVPALAGGAVPALAGMLGAKRMALTQREAETKSVCSKEETIRQMVSCVNLLVSIEHSRNGQV